VLAGAVVGVDSAGGVVWLCATQVMRNARQRSRV